jgi:hypothetical protein
MGYESCTLPLVEASAYKPVLSSEFKVPGPQIETRGLRGGFEPETFNFKSDTPFFSIPRQYGEVVETWVPRTTSSAFVVILQDVHDKPSVQWNEQEVLRSISHPQQPLLVAVEGAWQKLDVTRAAAFPAQDIKDMVTRALLDRGELTGEESLAIRKAPGEIILQGVEDKSLYLRNVDSRESSMTERQSVLSWLEETSLRLDDLESSLFPPSLRDLERNSRLFQEGTLPLGSYLEFLSKVSGDSAHYPVVSRALELSRLEKKLSPEAIKAEREALLSELSRRLSRKDLQGLLALSLAYRAGRVSALEFHEKLLGYAGSKSTPQLETYVTTLRLRESLSTDALLQELESFEAQVREELCRRYTTAYPVLRKLSDVSVWIREEKRLYSLELIPHETEKALSGATRYDFKDVADLASSLEAQVGNGGHNASPTIPDTTKALWSARQFYRLALERNKVLADNTLKLISGSRNPVVLVAGGYHTPGITEIFKAHHIPYVVVRPSLDDNLTEPARLKIVGDTKAVWSIGNALKSALRKVYPMVEEGDNTVLVLEKEAARGSEPLPGIKKTLEGDTEVLTVNSKPIPSMTLPSVPEIVEGVEKAAEILVPKEESLGEAARRLGNLGSSVPLASQVSSEQAAGVVERNFSNLFSKIFIVVLNLPRTVWQSVNLPRALNRVVMIPGALWRGLMRKMTLRNAAIPLLAIILVFSPALANVAWGATGAVWSFTSSGFLAVIAFIENNYSAGIVILTSAMALGSIVYRSVHGNGKPKNNGNPKRKGLAHERLEEKNLLNGTIGHVPPLVSGPNPASEVSAGNGLQNNLMSAAPGVPAAMTPASP